MSPPSPSAVALRLRTVLASPDFPTENARKAALRRIVHESAAGMRKEEASAFIESLRSRFPDRMLETARKAETLERRAAQLEEDLRLARVALRKLEEKVEGQELLLSRLFQAARGSTAPPAEAALLVPFIEAMVLLLRFAADQEAAAEQVDSSLGRARGGRAGASGASGTAATDAMPALLARLARGEQNASEILRQVEQRLRRMSMVAPYLLVGAQQSWKSGTHDVLELLDPKAAEAAVPSKVFGREAAVLREVRRRFEEFWGQFEKNIDHYYRGTLQKIYAEKMEERL